LAAADCPAAEVGEVANPGRQRVLGFGLRHEAAAQRNGVFRTVRERCRQCAAQL
jgi:hypothetical protein